MRKVYELINIHNNVYQQNRMFGFKQKNQNAEKQKIKFHGNYNYNLASNNAMHCNNNSISISQTRAH